MTDDQIGAYVKDRAGEVMSSFILVGFRGDNHVPLIITQLPDAQAAIAVNAVICGALGQGGFTIDAQEKPE